MTTSGTTSFTANRDQLIAAALRKINAVAQGETPAATMVFEAAFALNAMVKHWESVGIHLWTETEGTLWLQSGQAQYGLGGSSTDHAALSSAYNFTTLASNAASGASTITVTATTGFVDDYYIGVLLDSGDMFWTVESGAPAGSVITLDAVLTDSASAGNFVFVYQTQIERPLRIVGARKVQWNATPAQVIETPMNPMLARLDYRSLPNKLTTGVPTQAFYDPQLSTGQLYVWPAPQNALYGVNFTFYRTIQDFDTAANTPDLPQEWIRTLMWNLADELALEYDCPPQRLSVVHGMAAQSLDDVKGWDREPESLYAGISLDQRSGN